MCGKAFILTEVKKAALGAVSAPCPADGKAEAGCLAVTVWRAFFFVGGFELLGSHLNLPFCPSMDLPTTVSLSQRRSVMQ